MASDSKTILITGGLGFIGSHAAEKFAQNGYNVIVIDNLSRPQPNIKKQIGYSYMWQFFDQNWPQIQKLKLDIRNFTELQDLFIKVQPDIVLHTAGQTSAVGSIQNPQDDFENNVIGLFNTLEISRTVGSVKDFIDLSTNKVYGDRINTIPLEEGIDRYFPLNSELHGINEDFSVDQSKHTPYGISKLASELYVQEYGQLYGINTAVFRQSCIYGARQFGFVEQGWVSFLIIEAIKRKIISIYGNGKQVRDLLYIDDLTQLFSSYLEWPGRDGSHVYNIGGGSEFSISLLEAIKIIQDLLGSQIKYQFDSERPGDQKYYVSDVSKIWNELNWKPLISPIEGIQKTFEWHLENQELFE